MCSQSKKVKLNYDFINELLEDNIDSSVSEFDDSETVKTYNSVSCLESDVLRGKEIYFNLHIFIFYCSIKSKKLWVVIS